MKTEASKGSCLVFGYALDGLGGAQPLSPDDDSGPITWLHGDYSTADAESWLAKHDVDQAVIDAMTRFDTRPRTLRMDGGIMVVLRGVNTNPGAHLEDMVSVRFWVEPTRLVSLRQRRLLSIQDVRAELEAGCGPCNIGELFTRIIERLADRISDFVDALEEKVDKFEIAIESSRSLDTRSEVSAIRQQIAHVRRYLAPQRVALEALQRGIPDWLSEYAYAVGEQSDRIARYIEDLDLARERTVLLQEEILNRIAMEQNARTYMLSIVAVIFLPITFVTGMFGMNVGGLPGAASDSAFWVVSVTMIAISLGLVAWLTWKRWF